MSCPLPLLFDLPLLLLLLLALVLGEGGVHAVHVVREASHLVLQEEEGCLVLLLLFLTRLDVMVDEGGKERREGGREEGREKRGGREGGRSWTRGGRIPSTFSSRYPKLFPLSLLPSFPPPIPHLYNCFQSIDTGCQHAGQLLGARRCLCQERRGGRGGRRVGREGE